MFCIPLAVKDLTGELLSLEFVEKPRPLLIFLQVSSSVNILIGFINKPQHSISLCKQYKVFENGYENTTCSFPTSGYQTVTFLSIISSHICLHFFPLLILSN